MNTHLPYNDSPWKRKAHKPEAGYLIRHTTAASRFHGGLETVWYVRCPVSGKALAERESEDAARQAARDIAAARGLEAA